MQGIAPTTALRCTGAVTYTGLAQLHTDLDNLKAAVAEGKSAEDVFVPAPTGRGVGRNEYYATEDEFRRAVIDADRVEYRAILHAGFLLQLDDPGITNLWGQDPDLPLGERRTNAQQTWN
jgi:5-methyltetrahydropteroyltriglutamate--homocysteine methyltransferase